MSWPLVLKLRSRGVCASVGNENSGETVRAGPRIMFAAGGTGGHVYPALAIADEVKMLNPAAEIEFVGTIERMEWVAVPKAGFPISPIPAVAIRRPFWSLANVLLPFRLLLCLWMSWRIVRKFRPDVVVGTGGYVAGPLCLMAALAGTAVAIQEQNAYAGVTNRILGRVAKVIFIAFAAATSYFPKQKCVFIGNPTRRVLQQRIDRLSALRYFFGDLNVDGHEDLEVVVVMGGSLGARIINETMAEIASSLLEQKRGRYIIWQTGTINYDSTMRRVGSHPRLALLPYVDAMEMMYAAADIVVARAGAITCSELLVTATPAILIPATSVAEDHQMKNARAMAEGGAATILPERDLVAERLATVILNILGDNAEQRRMQNAALRMAAPDAAQQLAKHVLSLAS
nr:MurG transferase [Physcomitrium patens]